MRHKGFGEADNDNEAAHILARGAGLLRQWARGVSRGGRAADDGAADTDRRGEPVGAGVIALGGSIG
jgi:hypothetical protein